MTLKNLLDRLLGRGREAVQPEAAKPVPDVELRIRASAGMDGVELLMRGGEVMLGGAIIALMLRNRKFYTIIRNCADAADREITRQATAELTRLN